MAPSPENDKEPKAPDKSVVSISSDDSKVHYNHIKDPQVNLDFKFTISSANSDVENKDVETLDDGQLRALLDEAITYKCPKDREGKSSLFKELLEEVEQDEEACEAAARVGRGGRRGARGRREHHSSLQDLVAAMAAEPPRRNRHHHHSHASTSANVSARTHHGGSLPSGVDTSFLTEEPTRGGYLATVRCVNPPPLAERRVSASDANGPPDMELVTRRSKAMFPMTYTARATLEIGSGSVGSGRAVTTTTASNQVDSAIPFSCITTPEVVSTCSTTSTTQAAVAVDSKLECCYRYVASLTDRAWGRSSSPSAALPSAPPAALSAIDANTQPRSASGGAAPGPPLARPAGDTRPTADEYKKSLDENDNAVHGFGSPISGSNQHKKPRRKKSSKNETVIKSHQIDGYQGNKDINEVLRFIESNAEGARHTKLGRAKHKDDDDKGGKKRSTERRKDKESKPKRASSLEELSRTKLEDLTDKPAGRRRLDAQPGKPERRSWGETLLPDEPAPELTDFQTVTKRRKPRRRAEDGEPARPPRPGPSARPPSPDSNDDGDSVHSLPASRPSPPAAPHPARLPALASYADIARTRHNIPDLIESCNFYVEGDAEQKREPEPAVDAKTGPLVGDTEYPALAGLAGREGRRARDKPAGREGRGARRERPEPDVVADRRPPVVLAEAGRPRDLDGVTFGFDINETLLGGRARCDLLLDAPEPPPRAPPHHHTHHHIHLQQIVDYVANAWEEVVRCGSGKVRYFTE